jgi:hypothetical protein
MRKVTIELSDRDAKWLENNQKNFAWMVLNCRTVFTEGTERRVIDRVAKALVNGKKVK